MEQNEYLSAETARELTTLNLSKDAEFHKLMRSAQHSIYAACLEGKDFCKMSVWGESSVNVDRVICSLRGLGFIVVLNVCDMLISW